MKSILLRLVRGVALTVGSLAVVVVASELAVRAVYGKKYGPRPGFYVGDTRLGWKPNANLDHTFYGPDYKIKIRTDSDGYRLGALGEVDYTRDLVVVCGDSYSFGWGVSTDETFPSYLDQILYDASGGRTRVVNLGVGGYGMFQTCDRLARFLEKHPDAHIKALVVQHCVNDPVDNVATLGYHMEMWKTEDKQKPRSRFHLVNLVEYARLVYSQRNHRAPKVGAGKNRPYVQDLLWAFERQSAGLQNPTEFDVEDRRIYIDGARVPTDSSPELLRERKELSDLQRDLMLEAMHCIHSLCVEVGVRPVHLFIGTTPEWYVHDVEKLIRESAEFRGVDAVIAGRVPNPDEFDGPTDTGNSAGHYNAAFNKFWAEKTAEVLEDLK